MSELTFITAFKSNENTAKVLYRYNKWSMEFFVEWNNIDPATGEIVNFELQSGCMSKSPELNQLIDDAIEAGEDSDLYIELRDTFDRYDCEDLLAPAYTMFQHIQREFSGRKINFARNEGVEKQQVQKWVNGDFVVIGGALYSKRRELKKRK